MKYSEIKKSTDRTFDSWKFTVDGQFEKCHGYDKHLRNRYVRRKLKHDCKLEMNIHE